LKAALLFKIEPLLQLCQEKIDLTNKNLASLFVLARTSSLDILLQRCRAFVASKPETFEEFIESAELSQHGYERTAVAPETTVVPQMPKSRTLNLNLWRMVRTEPPNINLDRRILPPLVQAPVF